MIPTEAKRYLEILREAPQGPPGHGAREGALRALESMLASAAQERETLIRTMERASTELEGRVQELSLLRCLSLVLAETFESKELEGAVLRVLAEEQEVEDAAIWIADSEELHWCAGIGRGELGGAPSESACESAEMGVGLIGLTATRREALVVHDAQVEARCHEAESFLCRGSFCLFPLLCSGRIVGVMWLGSMERFAFPTERVRILSMAASQIAQGPAGSELFGRLSSFSESLSEVIEARSREIEEKSEEIRRTRAAWHGLLERLHVGGVASDLEPMPKSERLHQVVRNLRAVVAVHEGDGGITLSSALALAESFAADYDTYLDDAGRTGWPVLIPEPKKHAA